MSYFELHKHKRLKEIYIGINRTTTSSGLYIRHYKPSLAYIWTFLNRINYHWRRAISLRYE